MQGQARLEELFRGAGYFELHRAFGDELDQLARSVRELRRRALEIHTTPVRRLLERLPRVAFDLGRELGKRVRVELAGEEVEVDRAVLDHLDDALLHLVRNAVDHGLESESERIAAGKDPVGLLRLGATRVAGRLHLRIDEDGRGIDVEKVRRRAIERGLLVEMVAEDLPAERIRELIFEPGLSTKDQVSGVSGRGVGLDAVKRQVEALGGTIRVESESGKGTAFLLDLPSMVTLQRVLVLQVGGQRVALPILSIEAVLSAADAAVEHAGVDSFFMFKDEPLPLVDLGPRIGLPTVPPGTGCVVVLDARGFKLGVLVERVLDDREVFVRQNPEPLTGMPHLGGVAILRDGAPVFLLEIASLVENFA
jgi:two-component system, chemotaxis family, sensor kinase CheA